MSDPVETILNDLLKSAKLDLDVLPDYDDYKLMAMVEEEENQKAIDHYHKMLADKEKAEDERDRLKAALEAIINWTNLVHKIAFKATMGETK